MVLPPEIMSYSSVGSSNGLLNRVSPVRFRICQLAIIVLMLTSVGAVVVKKPKRIVICGNDCLEAL